MKQNTDSRIQKAKEVTKDQLVNKIKTSDPTRFDQMLIETEERKNYFFVKYNSIAYTRKPKTLKFPLFKDLVNDFEKSIEKSGDIKILEDDKIIQKVLERGSNRIKKSEEQKESTMSKISDFGSSLKNEKNLTSALGSVVKSAVNTIKENTEEKRNPVSNNPLGYYVPKENTKYTGKNLAFSELKIATENDKVKLKQPIYYLPSETERCTCNTCKGDMYTTCNESECRGQHIYDCSKCRTSGKLDCDDCNARGEYSCPSCNGRGALKCSFCDGSGRDKKSNSILAKCMQCNGSGERKCSSVNYGKGSGIIGAAISGVSAGVKKAAGNEYCGGSGKIRCAKCSATGKITCDKCEGDGKIECKTCHGDHIDNRYGKVDCKTCETAGELASISYIETEIKADNLELIFTDGKTIDAPSFGVDTIKKYANSNGQVSLTYKNLNGDNKEAYDDYSTFCSKNALTQIGTSKEKYPKLISEEIYYEGVPCATFNYNHILSATFHDVSVLSIDTEQDVLFHSNPTAVAEEKESIKEKVNELCRRAFSTKAYKDKIDRKHEMFLMVHMAKADGVIEEQEKKYLAQTITGLHGFTNKEKAELFGLMSANTLPAISPTNAYFSNKGRAEEAKKKIIELVAKADGDYEPQEKAKVAEINNAIELGFKAKPSAIGQFFKTWQVSVFILFLTALLGFGIYFFAIIYPQIKAEKKAKKEIELTNATRIMDSTLNAMNIDPSTIDLSEFKSGRITSKKAYFFEDKDGAVKLKSYCVIEDNIKYYPNSNTDFYYTVYKTKKGKEIKGWVNKTDILGSEVIPSEAEIITAEGEVDEEAISVLIGSWKGKMDDKEIEISIESIGGGELTGYNIVAGNKRVLKGTYKDGEWAQSCSKAFDAILNEPGDDKWDGVFTIKFVGYEDTNDNNECQGNLKGQEASGEWKSNNGKMKKEFNLIKK